MPKLLSNDKETFKLFERKENDNCNITSIELQDINNQPIKYGDPLYSRLYQNQWKNWSISIDTEINDTELQKTISFKVKAITDGGNIGYKEFEVRLGCFGETAIVGKFVNDNIDTSKIHYPSVVDDSLFDVELLVDVASPIYKLNIGSLLEWSTSHKNCGVSQISICLDLYCKSLVKTEGLHLAMKTNPTFKFDKNGTMPEIVMNITRSHTYEMDFYIKGFAGLKTTTKTFKIHLHVSQLELPGEINESPT